ncbi:hypothetical protein P168DRAFT_287016 [Aspergillus campestris IBT 28561]|uniref:Uncharacterized protein n=1 Tax=Aspergillus campestris (strain IBT 28561) TaxID=1392248 RepID=A0A2I1DGE1_ASPC2|nr:uncharacterized protein P168DRAFT_287016 [Aspergillus campestris IBT 28561]PKY08945.1 hypothetical protein P168DRAFT_287016 [Aspergillus campestris IBT 28561]
MFQPVHVVAVGLSSRLGPGHWRSYPHSGMVLSGWWACPRGSSGSIPTYLPTYLPSLLGTRYAAEHNHNDTA